MPVGLFQVRLSVQPVGGGQAQLAVPEALHELNYSFVIVKDGGEEGIVRVNAPKSALDQLAGSEGVTRLSEKQAEELRENYPPPRLKEHYRVVTAATPGDESMPEAATVEQFATDDQGNRVIETLQTIRAGFYLIDVPVTPA